MTTERGITHRAIQYDKRTPTHSLAHLYGTSQPTHAAHALAFFNLRRLRNYDRLRPRLPFLLLTTMFRLQALLVCALSVATTSAREIFTYQFDPALAAGVQGVIKVKYVDEKSSKATISADLDFSKVDLSEIQKFDGNCTSEIVEYKWHIHVKWSSPNTSDKLAQCSKAATSNHYDPLKACGPNSEYAETPECLPKISSYACNPANYTKDPLTCEKGDLSGKFGGFKLDASKKASGEWTDEHYPLVSENTPQWNMILHAVCGKATPRIACAVAQKEADSCLS